MSTFPLTLAGAAPVESPTEAAARGGDRAAWTALIARHDRRVVLTLVARGVPLAQAKEFAQEAWLRLIRQADAQRLARLELPGLAVRQALFLVASDGRRARGDELPLDAALELGDSPEVAYLSRERLARARALVQTLAPSARAVIERLYAEPRQSHAEVAAQVGLSVQRVRQILCEVRKVLRAEFELQEDA